MFSQAVQSEFLDSRPPTDFSYSYFPPDSSPTVIMEYMFFFI